MASPHDAGIPWEMISKQVVNITLFAGGLTYILRSKVKDYFQARVATFEKQAILAKKAKEDAENQRKEIRSKLQKLEETAGSSLKQAEQEAESLRKKAQEDSAAQAKQILEEASRTTQREFAKAKAELAEELLSTAMSATREQLRTSVKEPDQKRLQNEFVDKIQAVR